MGAMGEACSTEGAGRRYQDPRHTGGGWKQAAVGREGGNWTAKVAVASPLEADLNDRLRGTGDGGRTAEPEEEG